MKRKMNQRGFAAIEVVGILVLIGIVGFVGWRVYDASQNSGKSYDSASQSDPSLTTKKKSSTITPPPADQPSPYKVPDGYTEYKNTTLGFKFAYPKSWGTAKLQSDPASTDLFLLIFDGATDPKNGQMELRAQSADTIIRNSDAPYAKGYLYTNSQYYFRTKNETPDSAFVIKAEDILQKLSGNAGTTLLVRNISAIGSPDLVGLVNLKSTKFPGMNLTFGDESKANGDYSKNLYDDAELAVMKKVLSTFSYL